MARRTYDEKAADVIAAIPANGRIDHNALVTALESAGKSDAVEMISNLNKAKKIVPVVEADENAKVTLYYTRA